MFAPVELLDRLGQDFRVGEQVIRVASPPRPVRTTGQHRQIRRKGEDDSQNQRMVKGLLAVLLAFNLRARLQRHVLRAESSRASRRQPASAAARCAALRRTPGHDLLFGPGKARAGDVALAP